MTQFIEQNGRLLPQGSDPQQEKGIKTYGKLLGRFLSLVGYAEKVSLGEGKESYVNSNSLAKYILRTYSESKPLENVQSRPTTSIIPYDLFKKAVHEGLEMDDDLSSAIEENHKHLKTMQEGRESLEAIKHQLGARVDTSDQIRAEIGRAERAILEDNRFALEIALGMLRLETDALENEQTQLTTDAVMATRLSRSLEILSKKFPDSPNFSEELNTMKEAVEKGDTVLFESGFRQLKEVLNPYLIEHLGKEDLELILGPTNNPNELRLLTQHWEAINPFDKQGELTLFWRGLERDLFQELRKR